jgi:hypothetical protein
VDHQQQQSAQLVAAAVMAMVVSSHVKKKKKKKPGGVECRVAYWAPGFLQQLPEGGLCLCVLMGFAGVMV